jgi:hypothetical protein
MALAIFNLIDGIATFWGFRTGGFYEVNPLMRSLLEYSPWVFLAFKASFSLVFIWIWKMREEFGRILTFLLKGITTVYAMIMVSHVVNVILYICYW